MAATIPVGEIVLWRVATAAVANADLVTAGVNLATPATWTGTDNRAFYQAGSMHIGVVGAVQNAGGAGETCHVIFGLCAGNTVAERLISAGLIIAAANAGDRENRAIVTNIPVTELTKEIVINKRVFGGSRRRRQSKKRRNQRNHNNNQ
jgi:hypothetical protein